MSTSASRVSQGWRCGAACLEAAARAVQARRLASDRLVRANWARVAEVHPSERLVVTLLAWQALAELGGVQPLLAAAAQQRSGIGSSGGGQTTCTACRWHVSVPFRSSASS